MRISFVATALGLALCGVGLSTASADDALRRVQQSLHDQGFYYGSIDGAPGDETTQAIRRYQIRNGLGVTGQLNEETRRSIEPAGASIDHDAESAATPRPRSTPVPSDHRRPVPAAPKTAPAYRPQPPPARAMGPGNTDDGGNGAPAPRDSVHDRPDLRADGRDRPDVRVDPPGPGFVPRGGFAPSEALTNLFASTPYEFAPPPVQADVLRRAQAALRRDGYFAGQANGVPGPAIGGALSNFQRLNRLPRTGRLDVGTLGVMRLLPGRQTVDPRGDGRGGPGIIFQGRGGE